MDQSTIPGTREIVELVRDCNLYFTSRVLLAIYTLLSMWYSFIYFTECVLTCSLSGISTQMRLHIRETILQLQMHLGPNTEAFNV